MSELIKPMLPNAQENFISVRANSYPGRGIIIGKTPSGEKAITAYFITARSPGSQARVVIQDTEPTPGTDGEQNRVRVDISVDAPKGTDPTNLRYNAMRMVKDEHREAHVVSNGIQTDAIVTALEEGGTFEAAVATQDYEVDPEDTPRISGIISIAKGLRLQNAHLALVRRKLDFELIPEELAAREQDPKVVQSKRIPFHINLGRETYGTGLLLHTYRQNAYEEGGQVPSFIGGPYRVPLAEDISEIAETYWGALPNNDKVKKVAIVVKAVDLATGKDTYEIINTKKQ